MVRQIVAYILNVKWFNSKNPYMNPVSGQKSMRLSQRRQGEEAIPLDNGMTRPAEHTKNLFTAIITQRRAGRFTDRSSTEH
jgi:hypothetical protein